MAEMTIQVQLKVTNIECLNNLMEAIEEFADLYDCDCESREGENLRLALEDFVEQVKVCNCHGI